MNDIITNYRISSTQVKIVNHEGRSPFVLKTTDAINLAKESNQDLIQVAFDQAGNMAVCEIMELGKYKYNKQKKQPAQHVNIVKEFKFGLNIEDHDIDTKLKHAKELLEKKHPVKIIVFLKNWQKDQKLRAVELFNKIIEKLGEHVIEQNRKVTDKQLFGTYVKKS